MTLEAKRKFIQEARERAEKATKGPTTVNEWEDALESPIPIVLNLAKLIRADVPALAEIAEKALRVVEAAQKHALVPTVLNHRDLVATLAAFESSEEEKI